MTAPEDCIAARGLWPLTDDKAGIPIPDHVLADRDLSLIAKGLFTLLLANNGQPVNPYEDAYEDAADIAVAIEELIAAGLAVRVGP
ncbi:hypothetical protein PYV02_06785 [Leifsonia sp. H3M29-4]|uniref:hypothetical protein n=1 Tax=Salinibacterium metalliresistens TaxID=3031321 RepID=UPI0023DADB99|nr:hypothetical protein [Salinibacterium metalliresistens]MDF1478789.1 hypothetical protein [Salinibacterium metalliresistens]